MTAPPPHRPLTVRIINAVGAGLESLGLPPGPFEETRLLEAARRQTGLDDFGEEGFREGLRRLLESVNGEARLNFIGRVGARKTLTNSLCNRLLLQAHRKQHPEVARQQIRKPLFILGLPRTGTTVLFNLLALDPDTRAPLAWEVETPCPPPRAASYRSDPRIAVMEKQFAHLSRMAPRLKAIHEMGAELPQECAAITALEFMSTGFQVMWNVPTYQEWLDRQSPLPALRFHHRLLQHLQSEYAGERWVLKTPPHMGMIEELLQVYPDACIIHTHRDPIDAIPSLASLSYTMRGVGSDAVDPHVVGRQQTDVFLGYLQRALRSRERLKDRAEQFLDVQFEDVARDPVAVIERIYAFFGIPLVDATRRRMESFVEANPRGQHGEHRYSLEDFGLDWASEAPRFAEYCERFGITRSRQVA